MAQILSAGGVKPQLWRARPGRIAPKWRWAWDGLHVGWALWEGYGPPQALLSNRNAEALPTGWSWDDGERGRRLVFDATESGADTLLAVNTDTAAKALSQPPFSAVVVLNNAVDGGQSNTILANRDRTSEGFSSGGGWVLKLEQFNNTGVLGFTKIRANGNSDLQSTTTSPFGEFAVIGVTVEEDNNVILYLNGVPDDLADTSAIGDPNDPGITLGGLYASGSPQELVSADYMALYMWGRALDAGSHRMIAEDPFGPFRPTRRTTVFAAASGGTTVPPLAMYHYRRRRTA